MRGAALNRSDRCEPNLRAEPFVRIHHDHGENAGYFAQDTKSGMVVLRYPDSERLREMCEWMGWQVTDDPVPSMDE